MSDSMESLRAGLEPKKRPKSGGLRMHMELLRIRIKQVISAGMPLLAACSDGTVATHHDDTSAYVDSFEAGANDAGAVEDSGLRIDTSEETSPDTVVNGTGMDSFDNNPNDADSSDLSDVGSEPLLDLEPVTVTLPQVNVLLEEDISPYDCEQKGSYWNTLTPDQQRQWMCYHLGSWGCSSHPMKQAAEGLLEYFRQGDPVDWQTQEGENFDESAYFKEHMPRTFQELSRAFLDALGFIKIDRDDGGQYEYEETQLGPQIADLDFDFKVGTFSEEQVDPRTGKTYRTATVLMQCKHVVMVNGVEMPVLPPLEGQISIPGNIGSLSEVKSPILKILGHGGLVPDHMQFQNGNAYASEGHAAVLAMFNPYYLLKGDCEGDIAVDQVEQTKHIMMTYLTLMNMSAVNALHQFVYQYYGQEMGEIGVDGHSGGGNQAIQLSLALARYAYQLAQNPMQVSSIAALVYDYRLSMTDLWSGMPHCENSVGKLGSIVWDLSGVPDDKQDDLSYKAPFHVIMETSGVAPSSPVPVIGTHDYYEYEYEGNLTDGATDSEMPVWVTEDMVKFFSAALGHHSL